MQEQWLKISENLRKIVDSGTYNAWFAPLQCSVNGTELAVQAPNSFMADWLRKRQIENLKTAASSVLGVATSEITIEITVGESEAQKREADSVPVVRTIQNTLPLQIKPSQKAVNKWRYSFDDFVEGESNCVAAAAAKDICQKKGQLQTFFVNSASGLGKTHLSHAMGCAVTQANDGQRVTYLTAEDFASGYVTALYNKDLEGFKHRLKQSDMLLLEDVHFFRNKYAMQEMALNVVKDIQLHGGRVVFTSTFSPRELQKVDSQLVSYFCAGLVTSMGKPDRAMRREILQRKAKQLRIVLSSAVEDLLVDRLKGDVRQMESCLQSLAYKAKLLHSAITADLALSVLAQYATAENLPDLDSLTRLVCGCYGVEEKTLCGRSRSQINVMARNTIYFLARRHTDLALEEIGQHFNRSHSTVLKGIATVQSALDKQNNIGRQIASTISLVERQAGITLQR